MSLPKLYVSTVLAMVVALAAVAHDARFAPDGARSYPAGQSASIPDPSFGSNAWPTKSGIRQAVFRPVQSRIAADLGVGKLLVASRNLGDPNFAQTVILLIHYDADGAVGLILNRRTRVPLSEVFDIAVAKDRSDPVYLGGPVELPKVFALLQSPAKVEGARQILGGIYLISTRPLFEQTLAARAEPSVFHAYLGYAGWTRDQLRNEMELGSWFIFPADAKTVFDPDTDTLWSKLIAKTELQFAGSEPQPFHKTRL